MTDALRFRQAVPGDAAGIAALHADSWRRHYRGAYSDSSPDGDPTRLNGAPMCFRYVWPDPSTLLSAAAQ